MTSSENRTDPTTQAARRKRVVLFTVIAAVIALVAGGIAMAWAATGSGDDADRSTASEQPEESPEGSESSAPATPASDEECPEPTVEVASAEDLQSALDAAKPGDVISVAAGTYEGEFIASADGAADAPITVCGTAESILDGGGIKNGYVFHLDHVAHWVLQGFAVQNGQKGVMADGTTNSVIRGLTVSGIGDEAIHLRAASTDNQVIGNTISDTGLRKPKFGEGIYIGTAESNWCDISDCEPDPSDRNLIEGNTISATTSEAVDIKEGTSDGILRGNTFDGAALVEADSWVDVKGNNWIIEGNTGTNSAADGFQTHEILDGWGTGNVFRENTAQLTGSGVAFALEPERDNVVECSNTVSGPDAELTNVECRD